MKLQPISTQLVVPALAQTDKPKDGYILFDLKRGRVTDNGATPWYAVVGLGTPTQYLRYMIDTGTTHTWITTRCCTTEACLQHQRFDPTASRTFQWLDSGMSKTIDLGPWGTLEVQVGKDVMTLLRRVGDRVDPVVLKEKITLFFASRYRGKQFEQLVCDGGIAIPAQRPAGKDSDVLLSQLKDAGSIAYAMASFRTDARRGTGQCLLGAVDTSHFALESINIVRVIALTSFPHLWTVTMDSLVCGDTTVLTHVPLVLDTGSSGFKGDRQFIQSIQAAITQQGRLPSVLYGQAPDFSPYPELAIRLNGIAYILRPDQYFLEVESAVWQLAVQRMDELEGLLVVGSIFLDSVYSIFYAETNLPGVKAVGLALHKGT